MLFKSADFTALLLKLLNWEITYCSRSPNYYIYVQLLLNISIYYSEINFYLLNKWDHYMLWRQYKWKTIWLLIIRFHLFDQRCFIKKNSSLELGDKVPNVMCEHNRLKSVFNPSHFIYTINEKNLVRFHNSECKKHN